MRSILQTTLKLITFFLIALPISGCSIVNPKNSCESHFSKSSLNWRYCKQNRQIAVERDKIKAEVIEGVARTQTIWDQQVAVYRSEQAILNDAAEADPF